MAKVVHEDDLLDSDAVELNLHDLLMTQQTSSATLASSLANELEEQGYYIHRFEDSSMFQIMDKPWNEVDTDISLCFHVHSQTDGFLLADHMSYTNDAKQTTLIPYDLPNMLDIIIKLIGKCPHME